TKPAGSSARNVEIPRRLSACATGIRRSEAHLSLIRAAAAVLAFASGLACAQTLPFEPRHDAGQSVTGAFEGWFKNPDGSFSLLLGYYNRNQKQEIDIPIGPLNRIEPGGPDR